MIGGTGGAGEPGKGRHFTVKILFLFYTLYMLNIGLLTFPLNIQKLGLKTEINIFPFLTRME